MGGEFGIVANVTSVDRVFRLGAKVWLVDGTGGEGWYRFVWVGLSRSKRIVKKWAPTKRFNHFRCAFIPAHIRAMTASGDLYMEGTRENMEKRASALNEFRGQ